MPCACLSFFFPLSLSSGFAPMSYVRPSLKSAEAVPASLTPLPSTSPHPLALFLSRPAPASFHSLRASAVYPCLTIRLACYVLPPVLTSLYLFAANYAHYFVLRIIDHFPARSRPGCFKHSFLLSQS
ncbi:hypothetical protein BJV74DRAFT_121919 [Russula compacta]|nr:hypothetical protein BJV74DRAFT_121919 [Russula compacta]